VIAGNAAEREMPVSSRSRGYPCSPWGLTALPLPPTSFSWPVKRRAALQFRSLLTAFAATPTLRRLVAAAVARGTPLKRDFWEGLRYDHEGSLAFSIGCTDAIFPRYEQRRLALAMAYKIAYGGGPFRDQIAQSSR
jgi:hypothetical protein